MRSARLESQVDGSLINARSSLINDSASDQDASPHDRLVAEHLFR